MAKEDNLLKGNPATQFTKDSQPSPEAKSAGKRRVKTIKDALAFFGQQLKLSSTDEDGKEVDITRESAIINKLYEKAEKGDLKAIELLSKLGGWNAPVKVAETDKEGNDIVRGEHYEGKDILKGLKEKSKEA